jgi:Cu+-exporting ATPase
MATFGLLNPILAALLHHVSSVFVVVNAGRLYFTGIEQSIIGPVFEKMDELTDRKRLCRADTVAANTETAAEISLEQES